jgi:N-acetylglucosamine-6-phosphate deacetylase
MKNAFTCATCITPVEKIREVVVLAEDGVVTSVGPRTEVEIPAGFRITDFGDAVLAPGFVDIHIHGGGGHDVMDNAPDALAIVERHLAKHGTTSYFPTTVTAPVDQTLTALERLADAIEGAATPASQGSELQDQRALRARPLGVHLEGPFISCERRGVHPPEHVKEASLQLFDRMWQAARGHISIMTVAPEIAGALELIREATRRGVCVSIGHSNATVQDAKKGIESGARHATHTFNAMRPMYAREPGIVGAVLTDDRLTAEIIADGVHVAPEMIRLFLKAKGPDRASLVTDAISATGMPDGQYPLGSFTVEVKGNVCLSRGKLAGSVLTLDRAVGNIMKFANWPLEKALRLATLNPATTAGVSARNGVIAPGAAADFVVLTCRGELMKSIIAARDAGALQ